MATSRRLAAIMFTDIVGYTALMGRDEKKAIELLRANRNLHKGLIHQYNGKLLKEMGDGILASFPTITDAVYCAGSIQKETAQIEGWNLRIGIHQGEILLEGDDIYGDGVNIASRIEGLGDAGQILVSEPVFNNIKNRTGITGQSEGEHQFKNVDRPVRVYSVKVDEFPEVAPVGKSGINRRVLFVGLIGIVLLVLLFTLNPFQNSSSVEKVNTLNSAEIDKSIAALPFRNLSDDQSNQHFCDGILDGVLNNLSTIKDLRVISRTSIEKYRETTLQTPEIARELNVSYLLEASVFKSGDQIRVTAQLLDANRDQHIWSDQYDRDVSDVFTVMSEISKEVASEIKAVIKPEEEHRMETIPTKNMEAYELYLKGLQYDNDFFFRKEQQDLRLAIHFYESALELDPGFFLAKVNLAWTYIQRSDILGEGIQLYDSALHIANDLLDQFPDRSELLSLLGYIYLLKGTNKELAKEMLIRAVTLNPNDSKALSNLASYYRHVETRYDLSLILNQRAASIQPNNAFHFGNQGWNWSNLNKPDKAEPLFLKALEIQPDYSSAIISLALLYIEYYSDFEKGISLLLQGLSYNPNGLDIISILGEDLSWKGDFEESERYFLKVKEVVEQKDYTITRRTPWFPHRYAYTLWNLGRKEEARKYFQQQIDRDLSFLEDRVQSFGFYAYYDLAAVNAFLGNKEQAYYWLREILENNSWARSSQILIDPLFNPIKEEEAFKKFVDTYNRRMEREVKHYEELKDLPFNEFLQRIDEPLPQFGDLLD